LGNAPEKVVSRDAMLNPAAMDYFIRFAQESIDYDIGIRRAQVGEHSMDPGPPGRRSP
jgi:hypothetical protein